MAKQLKIAVRNVIISSEVMLVEGSVDYTLTKDVFVQKISSDPSTPVMNNMHYHSDWEVYFLIKGERKYFVEESFFKLSEGDIIWIPKNCLHRTEGGDYTRILILFSDEYLETHFSKELCEFLTRQKEAFVLHPLHEERNQLTAIMENAIDLVTQKDAHTNPALACEILKILHYLTSHSSDDKKRESTGMSDILSYINRNFNKIEKIEDVTRQFFISDSYFSRMFSQKMGVTFITYLNSIKIRHACALMKRGCHTISEVASSCGFSSTSYFCKVFKRTTNLSPMEFIKNAKIG